jgi:hypothetical protein
LLLAALSLAVSVCSAQSFERSLLLVTASNYELGPVTHEELRKIFLGVPITREGVRLRPLFNSTDPAATNIFLQKVVFMSEREYKRQLVSRVFRLGGQRPREYDDLDSLVADLQAIPGALTFMWSDQLEDYDELKQLAVIWVSSDD